MNVFRKLYFVVVLLLVSTLQLMAQQKITGRVIDEDGFAVSYASVQYRGHKIAVSSDSQGKFSIEKHPGWVLTVSALSYKSQTISVNEKMDFIEVKLKDDSHKLNEVVVKTKRGKYSRKDNPAVELMRRVIAAKKKTDLSNHDYYQGPQVSEDNACPQRPEERAAGRQVLQQATVSSGPGGDLSL